MENQITEVLILFNILYSILAKQCIYQSFSKPILCYSKIERLQSSTPIARAELSKSDCGQNKGPILVYYLVVWPQFDSKALEL